MSAEQPATIPYERQEDPHANRLCGAACLCMVYRSYGKPVTQADVWPRIARYNRSGRVAATTHLMAQDALTRGFPTLAIQARHPLQVLRLCQQNGVQAVLNHRLKADSPEGHYTVLVDVDSDGAVLHDPWFGPARRVSHAELLELWLPRYSNTEITGNVLIAVAEEGAAAPACRLCGTVMPPKADCPGCGKTVVLQPAAILGCASVDCGARMWNSICCPFCNQTFTLDAAGPAGDATGSAPAGAEGVLDLANLMSELDRFCGHVLSFPAAAANSDIRQQLDFIAASKDRLRLAQSEDLARRRMQRTEAEQREQKFRKDEEELVKKREQLQKPSPPADGNALGRSLLKDLGLA